MCMKHQIFCKRPHLPNGKLNEGVKHVDVCVGVALPEVVVKGGVVHLSKDDV